MSEPTTLNEYLVISRGKWDEDLDPATIQTAIDKFYDWHDAHVRRGTMTTGSRLKPPTKLVSKRGIHDGPFAETKEVIGGYWSIRAKTLEEAAALAAENPVLPYGLMLEIRQLEPARANAYEPMTETPTRGKS
jgi:hypothetical protein